MPEEEPGRIENQEALELIHQADHRRAEQEVRRRPGKPAPSAGSPGEQGKAGRGQGKEGKTDKGAEEDMEKSSGSSWAALTERRQRHSGE